MWWAPPKRACLAKIKSALVGLSLARQKTSRFENNLDVAVAGAAAGKARRKWK